MIKDKKAQIAGFLSDTVLLIFMIFLLVVFFIASSVYFGFSKNEIEKSALQYNLESSGHISLNAFLQKPVEVEINGQKQKMTGADLIRLSKIDAKYDSVLKPEIKSFDSYYDCAFRTEADAETINASIREFNEKRTAHFYIPSENPVLVALQISGMKK